MSAPIRDTLYVLNVERAMFPGRNFAPGSIRFVHFGCRSRSRCDDFATNTAALVTTFSSWSVSLNNEGDNVKERKRNRGMVMWQCALPRKGEGADHMRSQHRNESRREGVRIRHVLFSSCKGHNFRRHQCITYAWFCARLRVKQAPSPLRDECEWINERLPFEQSV